MQWKDFKSFVGRVLKEGRRLQRYDIAGKLTTTRRYTHTQILCFVGALVLLFLLPQGVNDNFAEYAIAFLGIFVGLFTSIIIALYDKSNSLYDGIQHKTGNEKSRIAIIRNYLVQFTGLTAYTIILALIAVVLLLGILLFPETRINIWKYHFIDQWRDLNLTTTLTFLRLAIVILFRVFLFNLLLNFFLVTLYSLSSYFSFLQSEYKTLGLSSAEEK